MDRTGWNTLGISIASGVPDVGSLRTKVSVAGKRNFPGRDKEAETASKVQGRSCRDKVSLNKPANSGLISEN
jgi:hypothetical protein